MLEPVAFLRRWVGIIPRPRHHLVRYASVFGPASKARSKLRALILVANPDDTANPRRPASGVPAAGERYGARVPRPRRSVSGVSWLLGVLLAVIAGCAVEPATGANPEDEASPTKSASGSTARSSRHCVVAPSGETTCFGTFTEAIAVATAGEIPDVPADPRPVDVPSFAARIKAIAERVAKQPAGRAASGIAPLANVVIGIVYKDANFGGDTWVFNQSIGCDGNVSTVDFTVPNLNANPFTRCDFNDNISSFHSFSNCQTVLYEDFFFGGAATNGGTPIADLSFVGSAMNDRASSIRWL